MAQRTYLMNTKSAVPTSNPNANEFTHSTEKGCIMLYLQPLEYGQPKGAVKVVADYAGMDRYEIGETLWATQDTGLGHRKMKNHKVVAIMGKDETKGELPAKKTLAFWVTK
jgi:hypothetical protein